MKRIFFIFFATSIALLPSLQRRVHAATPTPTPQPTIGVVPTGRAVNAGALNSLLDNSKSYTFSGSEPSIDITISNVNLSAGSDFNVPDLGNIATMFENAAPLLTPRSIQQQTVNEEANLYISGKARYCKYNQNGTVETKISASPYKTEIIPELSTLDQASRQIAPLLTRYSISKTNGQYDFRRDPLEIANAPECDAGGSGTAQEEKAVKTTMGISIEGWILNLLRSVFGQSGTIRATLSSKQLTPYAESMDCLITGCKNGTDLSYLSDEKEQETVEQGGGMAQTYAPISHDVTKGQTHGEQTNTFSGGSTVQTHTAYTKAIENASDYMKCMIVPKAVRAQFGLTDKCQVTQSCNSGTLPDLTVSDNACKLCNIDNIENYVDDLSSVPSGTLPPTMVAIIEKAAETFHVPPSLLVGTMYHEGAFSAGRYEWSEQNVRKWSFCGEEMPKCDKTQTNTTQPPFGWIPAWFYQGDGANALWNAVQTVDPSRSSKDMISPCNFMDGTFAMAKALSLWYARKNADVLKNNVTICSGAALINTGASPTSCSWDEARVVQASVGYGGYCPDAGKHSVSSAMPTNNLFIDQAKVRFRAFKCY